MQKPRPQRYAEGSPSLRNQRFTALIAQTISEAMHTPCLHGKPDERFRQRVAYDDVVENDEVVGRTLKKELVGIYKDAIEPPRAEGELILPFADRGLIAATASDLVTGAAAGAQKGRIRWQEDVPVPGFLECSTPEQHVFAALRGSFGEELRNAEKTRMNATHFLLAAAHQLTEGISISPPTDENGMPTLSEKDEAIIRKRYKERMTHKPLSPGFSPPKELKNKKE